MQFVANGNLGPQEPNAILPLVLRAGERALVGNARLTPKAGSAPSKPAGFRQDHFFAEAQSLSNGRIAQYANSGRNPFTAALSKHPKSRSSRRSEAPIFRDEAEGGHYVPVAGPPQAKGRAYFWENLRLGRPSLAAGIAEPPL